jgi:hypothetical protein
MVNFVGIPAETLTKHRTGPGAEVWQIAPHVNFVHCVIQ